MFHRGSTQLWYTQLWHMLISKTGTLCKLLFQRISPLNKEAFCRQTQLSPFYLNNTRVENKTFAVQGKFGSQKRQSRLLPVLFKYHNLVVHLLVIAKGICNLDIIVKEFLKKECKDYTKVILQVP